VFKKTYHATHPDMMDGATNEQLRDRHLIAGPLRPGAVGAELFAQRALRGRGGHADGTAISLPSQTEPASAAGHPFLERRELGVVNVSDGAGQVSVDGTA